MKKKTELRKLVNKTIKMFDVANSDNMKHVSNFSNFVKTIDKLSETNNQKPIKRYGRFLKIQYKNDDLWIQYRFRESNSFYDDVEIEDIFIPVSVIDAEDPFSEMESITLKKEIEKHEEELSILEDEALEIRSELNNLRTRYNELQETDIDD